jgi:hypothetical protein
MPYIAISIMLIGSHKLKFKELKSKLVAQQQLKAKARSYSSNAKISFFKVSNLIVKKCKSFA